VETDPGTSLLASHFVRRPNATTVCNATFAVESTCVLDAAGTHQVRVKDHNGPNTGNYRIAVQRLNNPTGCTALTFGAAPTTGTITNAGEMDCFTLNGTNLDRVRIRVIRNTSGDPMAPQTEVVRPNGTTVCGPDTAINQNCPQLDVTGTHRIIVRDGSSAGTATGTYRLQIQRLNNPNSCVAVTAGAAPTSGAIAVSPEMDCFTYNASTAGEVLRVRTVETSGDLLANVEVLHPNGTTVAGCEAFFELEKTCTLGAAGNYRILVRDHNGHGTGNYNVAVQRLNNPTGCTALTFGAAPTTGTITKAGEMDCFTLNGTNLDRIRVRIIRNTPGDPMAPQTEVVRPNGTTVCALDTAINQNCGQLDVTGTHRIIVRDGASAGTATGTYRLQIQRLNNPNSCVAVTAGAAPTSAAIAVSPEMDCFTYNASTASQVLRVRTVETSGDLLANVEVLHPNGTTVAGCEAFFEEEKTCTLGAAGNYRVLVRDHNGHGTGNYKVAVQRLDSPTGCVALTFGAAPTSATITNAGEMDCFTLNGTSQDRVRVRIVRNTAADPMAPETEVIRPNGTTVCNPDTAINQNCGPLDVTGPHRIIVRDGTSAGTQTGTYRLQIQRLNNPNSCTTVTAGAAPTSGAVTPSPEMDCFTYNASTAGQVVRVRTVETSGDLLANMEVLHPNGTTVAGCEAFFEEEKTCTLGAAGNYRVLVRDHNGHGTGNYKIALQRLDNPSGCTALTYGAAPTSATIANVGEMDCYTMSGANLDRLRIRLIRNAPGDPLAPEAEVVRPNGTTVCNPDTAINQNCGPLDATGTHRILVRDGTSAGTATGTYRLQVQRLNNPGSCPAISLGATGTTGTITTSPEMDCYTYNSLTNTTKIRVRVAETGASPSLLASIEVVRPNGTTVPGCEPSFAIEANCNLDTTGNHRILVRDHNGPNTGGYGISLRRLDATGACETLIEAASVIRPISVAAEQDCYAFSAQSGTTYPTELGGLGGFVASIEWIRPNGTTVCGPAPSSTSASDACTVDATGIHEIIIRDHSTPGTATGNYFLAVG
jgi:hypothetical protein